MGSTGCAITTISLLLLGLSHSVHAAAKFNADKYYDDFEGTGGPEMLRMEILKKEANPTVGWTFIHDVPGHESNGIYWGCSVLRAKSKIKGRPDVYQYYGTKVQYRKISTKEEAWRKATVVDRLAVRYCSDVRDGVYRREKLYGIRWNQEVVKLRNERRTDELYTRLNDTARTCKHGLWHFRYHPKVSDAINHNKIKVLGPGKNIKEMRPGMAIEEAVLLDIMRWSNATVAGLNVLDDRSKKFVSLDPSKFEYKIDTDFPNPAELRYEARERIVRKIIASRKEGPKKKGSLGMWYSDAELWECGQEIDRILAKRQAHMAPPSSVSRQSEAMVVSTTKGMTQTTDCDEKEEIEKQRIQERIDNLSRNIETMQAATRTDASETQVQVLEKLCAKREALQAKLNGL